MTLYQIITSGYCLIPPRFDSPEARTIMHAIALQESAGVDRWQVVDLQRPDVRGPARGLWQFERGGGVRGVMRHRASEAHARAAVRACGLPWDETAVWEALAERDDLAAAFARLLLLTDPPALPRVGDVEGAWATYLRLWRPGAYTRGSAAARASLRAKWGRNYAEAMR